MPEALELARLTRVVGRDGEMGERMRMDGLRGGWETIGDSFNTLIGDNNFNATSASDSNLVVGRGSFTRSVFGSGNMVIGYAVASNATTGLTGGSSNFLVGMDQTVTTPTTTTSSYWNLWNVIKGSVVAATGMLTSLVGGPFFFWLLWRTRRTSGGWA